MFLGSFEIGISVIVKYVQSIGIFRASCLPGGTCFNSWENFSMPGRTEEIAGLWFARGEGGGVMSHIYCG